jgi:predicted alternative tryptophan synthase beta-subunit
VAEHAEESDLCCGRVIRAEINAGQWGSALAFATCLLDIVCEVRITCE